MTLRIAYITDERFPYWATDTQQIAKNADALARAGADVTLFVPRRLDRTVLSPTAQRESIRKHYGIGDALDIRPLPGVPSSRLRVEKLVHGAVAPLVAALEPFDVVYTRNVLPTTIAVELRKPVVFENHRDLRRHYPVSYRAIRRLVRRENFLGVVTNCELVRRAYEQMGFSDERLLVAHLGYDPKDFEPRVDKLEARRQLGWQEDRVTVVYTGHIGPQKGTPILIELAERLPDVVFKIVGGNNGDVTRYKTTARERGLANIQFQPFVPIEEVPRYLFAADALIVPPTRVPLERYGNTVLPMKLYTYLAAGRPIIAPRLPDIEELLDDGETAILVPPDDVDAAARHIEGLLGANTGLDRLERAALAISGQYSWQTRGQRILEFIERRLDRAPRQAS